MLQRYVIHLALVFLFAFTQMGVATHEISHLTDASQHTRQDSKSQSKHSATEQCSQCISYAKIANALHSSSFTIPLSNSEFITTATDASSFESQFRSAYLARAPPQIISI